MDTGAVPVLVAAITDLGRGVTEPRATGSYIQSAICDFTSKNTYCVAECLDPVATAPGSVTSASLAMGCLWSGLIANPTATRTRPCRIRILARGSLQIHSRAVSFQISMVATHITAMSIDTAAGSVDLRAATIDTRGLLIDTGTK